MNIQPPKWAARFLEWYCNPDLLEEIQGDTIELYEERLKAKGKFSADLKFTLDVFRFFRWSNIRRTDYVPGSTAAIWALNFKLTARNAGRNKLVFFVKTLGLSLSLSFSLLLTAYILNELTYDQFHTNSDRLYRITSKVNFGDHLTHYAVTPLPLGKELKEKIPEIEQYSRFMYDDKPIYRINDNLFYNEVTISADSNFLNVFDFEFIRGDKNALNESNYIVLTESTAQKFFGDADPMGQSVQLGKDFSLEVSGVIKDVPSNSHLKFDVLISWDTFERYDDWGNLNAYTYVLLKENASLQHVQSKLPEVLDTFMELVAREYKATYEPVFENIKDIHLSPPLDEDIAEKKNKTNLFVLIAVVVLFLITGIINYLNLSLAELTANLKKVGIVRVFGGVSEGHKKIILTEIIFTLAIMIPCSLLTGWIGWLISERYLSIHINPSVIYHPVFIGIGFGFLFCLLISTRINAFLLTHANQLIHSLKGKFNVADNRLSLRKVLVGLQLSFSIVMIGLVILVVDQFHYLQDADKGFQAQNILLIKSRNGNYSKIETFAEELKKISGIAEVGRSTFYPGILETKFVFQVESPEGMKQQLVPLMLVSPDLLPLLNVKLTEGRMFKEAGDDHHFIINETAAREFGWKNALDKHIQGPVGGTSEFERDGRVIGLVKDFNFSSLHDKIEPLVIMLLNPNWANQYTYARLDPLHQKDVITYIEKQYKVQWPESPFEWEYLDSKYMSLYQKDHEMKNIFEVGLVISILISCLGIFSISALLASLRTKEMSIRKVVGAHSLHLFILHTKSFLQFLLISIVIAWPAIWYLSDQWLKNFAYHVEVNYRYFIIPGVVVLFITLITSGYHGIKNALVSPVDTLKQD